MSYWLHRISNGKNVSYPLLEKERYISIGFSDYSNKDFLQKVLADDGYMRFLDNMEISPKLDWIRKYRAKYNLWYFITDMKIDDIVIVPKYGGEFWICKIKGNAKLICDESVNLPKTDWHGNEIIKENGKIKLKNSNEVIDIGYVREVEILGKFSRAKNADATLTAKMKYFGTILKIDDSEKSIKSTLQGQTADLSEITEKFAKTLKDEIYKKLNPDKFEKLVKWYFDKIGASKTYIPPKNRKEKQGNDDVDIEAIFENIKTIINVQAKFYDGETDE